MKHEIISILTNQFRILPLVKFQNMRIKIPKDSFFELALQFFNLRCIKDPKLINVYTLWNEKFIESHTKKRKFFTRRHG